eukprot:UN2789
MGRRPPRERLRLRNNAAYHGVWRPHRACGPRDQNTTPTAPKWSRSRAMWTDQANQSVSSPWNAWQLSHVLALLHQVVLQSAHGGEVEHQGRTQGHLELLGHHAHERHARQAVHTSLHEGAVQLKLVVGRHDVLHEGHELLAHEGGVQTLRLGLSDSQGP